MANLRQIKRKELFNSLCSVDLVLLLPRGKKAVVSLDGGRTYTMLERGRSKIASISMIIEHNSLGASAMAFL